LKYLPFLSRFWGRKPSVNNTYYIMGRFGKLLDNTFSNNSTENTYTMSSIRVLNKYHEWSNPVYMVDKKFFINLVLTRPISDSESEDDQLETSVSINDGKIGVKKAGVHKPTGLVIPQFYDVATNEPVDYDSIETLSLQECILTDQLHNNDNEPFQGMSKLMQECFRIISSLADIPEEGGEDYRIILKFCNE